MCRKWDITSLPCFHWSADSLYQHNSYWMWVTSDDGLLPWCTTLTPHPPWSSECWRATASWAPPWPTGSSCGCTLALPQTEVDLGAPPHACVWHSWAPPMNVWWPCQVDTMVYLIEPGRSNQAKVRVLCSPQFCLTCQRSCDPEPSPIGSLVIYQRASVFIPCCGHLAYKCSHGS